MSDRGLMLICVAIVAFGAVMVVAIAWAEGRENAAEAEACTHARDVAACLRDIK